MTSKEALEHIVNNDYNTIITTYPSQQAYNDLTKKEMAEIIKKDLDKLSQLEDIEEELGIDLITLFKALKNGFYYKNYKSIFRKESKNYDYVITFGTDLVVIQELYFEDLDGVLDTTGQKWYVEDYGKTWALTKEELENETH